MIWSFLVGSFRHARRSLPAVLGVALTVAILISIIPPQVAVAALPAPELVSPAPGDPTNPLSFPPEGVPTFTWTAVPGAAKYHIDVNTAVGFNGTVLENADTYNTSYTPRDNTGFAGGQYYWHVCAISSTNVRGPGCGPGDEYRSFTQGLDLSVNLSTPEDNPSGDRLSALPFTPRFAWEPVAAADHYVLDISTDPSFGTHVAGYPLNTDATTYTPLVSFRNDVNYYWRVKAVDHRGNEGAPTTYRTFVMTWSYATRRPNPMTPTNGAQNVGFPVFSWVPVQGASKYHLEVHKSPDSMLNNPTHRVIGVDTQNTTWVLPIDSSWSYALGIDYYWAVTAYNANGLAIGQQSDIFTFRSGSGSAVTPSQLYPPYYYNPIATNPEWPNDSLAGTATGFVNPTVSIPTFMWNRIPGSHTYELQISDNNNFLGSPFGWTQSFGPTANLSFTPTSLTSLSGSNTYYWRVRSFDNAGPWSQPWKTRIDTSALAPKSPAGSVPNLERPTYKTEWDGKAYGQEAVEFFPNLEWTAVDGANNYRIQFSTDSGFSPGATTEVTTPYTNYTPLEQAPYGYGTYYWRAKVDGPTAVWSSTSHFILETPPRYIDPTGAESTMTVDGVSTFTLDQQVSSSNGNELYAAIGRDNWYFGFDAKAGDNATYLLYVDVDHSDRYGGGPDASLGLPFQAATPHRPEYVVKFVVSGGAMSVANNDVWLYSWNGSTWSGQSLSSVDWGHLPTDAAAYSGVNQFVEIGIPKPVLSLPNMQTASSLSLKLFAVSGTDVSYSLPAEVTPPAGEYEKFVTVTSAPQPVLPPNQDASGSEELALTPRFAWHTTDGAKTYRFQAATDGGFSSVVNFGEKGEGWVPNVMSYAADNSSYAPTKAWADNTTYFWRLSTVNPYGATDAWGETVSFRLKAFAPTQLGPGSVVDSGQPIPLITTTPKFSWDPVEGAALYRLELIRDGDNFAAPWKTWETENTSYTPTTAIPDGTYYWRVKIKKSSGSYGPASVVLSLNKQADQVVLLGPPTGSTLQSAPTFKWVPSSGASYYTIQTATDINFSKDLKTIDTDNCAYTPTELWKDRTTYYWRVRPMDGNANPGPYNGATVIIDNRPFSVYLPLVIK